MHIVFCIHYNCNKDLQKKSRHILLLMDILIIKNIVCRKYSGNYPRQCRLCINRQALGAINGMSTNKGPGTPLCLVGILSPLVFYCFLSVKRLHLTAGGEYIPQTYAPKAVLPAVCWPKAHADVRLQSCAVFFVLALVHAV